MSVAEVCDWYFITSETVSLCVSGVAVRAVRSVRARVNQARLMKSSVPPVMTLVFDSSTWVANSCPGCELCIVLCPTCGENSATCGCLKLPELVRTNSYQILEGFCRRCLLSYIFLKGAGIDAAENAMIKDVVDKYVLFELLFFLSYFMLHQSIFPLFCSLYITSTEAGYLCLCTSASSIDILDQLLRAYLWDSSKAITDWLADAESVRYCFVFSQRARESGQILAPLMMFCHRIVGKEEVLYPKARGCPR